LRGATGEADVTGAPTPTAVVFDLGGVLIDWDPRYLYRTLFDGDDAAMEAFLSEVVTQEWNGHQDAGRPWSEAIEVLAAKHPERRDLIAAFWERWPEMLGGALDDTVAILAELRAAGVRVYALSNWSAETFPRARPRFPFLDWFDGIVISGEVKLVKPDPRIFSHLLETHGLAADRTVFVDDSETNVAAAVALGMIGIHFDGAEALRRELRSLGLPVSEPEERRRAANDA
jgi:2-haloacid dehalogenase